MSTFQVYSNVLIFYPVYILNQMYAFSIHFKSIILKCTSSIYISSLHHRSIFQTYNIKNGFFLLTFTAVSFFKTKFIKTGIGPNFHIYILHYNQDKFLWVTKPMLSTYFGSEYKPNHWINKSSWES